MDKTVFWYDKLLGKSWATLWHGYIRCGNCSGIRTTIGLCPSCGEAIPVMSSPLKIQMADGSVREIASNAFAGAEDRYEDWVYLEMLESEWLRPLKEDDQFLSVVETSRPSARAIK